MASKNEAGDATAKKILETLTTTSNIAGILFTLLSLFVEEKSAKQLSFGLAFAIPAGAYWYQRRKSSEIKIENFTNLSSSKAADKFLKQYIALRKTDPGTHIPYHRLQWIEKHASQKLLNNESANELIKASRSSFYWVTGTNIVLGILLLITLYAFITTNYEFNPVDYFFGRSRVEKQNPFISLESLNGTMIFGTETPSLETGEQPLTPNMTISTFSMHMTEVTNNQYRSCRRAGYCKQDPVPSPDSPHYYEESKYDSYPVVGVTAYQAREFCQWLGGDLPTSQQWERAARGLMGRSWPWLGTDLSADRANLYTVDGSSKLAPVTEFSAGGSPEGIQNLVGNAAEWTRTVLFTQDDGATYLMENWNGIESKVALAVRGGSWGFQMTRVTEPQLSLPGDFGEYTSFRCVISQ